jgi:hypothetical protein
MSSTGGGGSSTTSAAGATQVSLKNIAIDPVSVTIKAGESVTWTNNDPFDHHLVGDNGEFDGGDLAAGATFTFTFKTADTSSVTALVLVVLPGTRLHPGLLRHLVRAVMGAMLMALRFRPQVRLAAHHAQHPAPAGSEESP